MNPAKITFKEKQIYLKITCSKFGKIVLYKYD